MSKWADHVITAIRRAPGGGHITDLEVREDNGTTIGVGIEWTRAKVIQFIDAGYTFETSYMRNGSWQRGAAVHAVRIGTERYLRTDRDSIRADNLGELPELPPKSTGVWR